MCVCRCCCCCSQTTTRPGKRERGFLGKGKRKGEKSAHNICQKPGNCRSVCVATVANAEAKFFESFFQETRARARDAHFDACPRRMQLLCCVVCVEIGSPLGRGLLGPLCNISLLDQQRLGEMKARFCSQGSARDVDNAKSFDSICHFSLLQCLQQIGVSYNDPKCLFTAQRRPFSTHSSSRSCMVCVGSCHSQIYPLNPFLSLPCVLVCVYCV